jgi:hypothetical protein
VPACGARHDLTALAAALSQLGNPVQLSTTPPYLAVPIPGQDCCQHLYAGTGHHPGWFCWQHSCLPEPPVPFLLRTDPMPLTALYTVSVLRLFSLPHHGHGQPATLSPLQQATAP